VEHPGVLKPLEFLERLGAKVTLVPVDRQGRVDPESVRRALTPRTILVSVMHANDEVGRGDGPVAAQGAGLGWRRWISSIPRSTSFDSVRFTLARLLRSCSSEVAPTMVLVVKKRS